MTRRADMESSPEEVTRDDLGHLGGNARFHPPAPDRSQQIATGQRPTAQRSALYPWWYWL